MICVTRKRLKYIRNIQIITVSRANVDSQECNNVKRINRQKKKSYIQTEIQKAIYTDSNIQLQTNAQNATSGTICIIGYIRVGNTFHNCRN